LQPNWEPAFEWAAFAVQRAGGHAIPSGARVTPAPDEQLGLPFTSGFRVELAGVAPAPPPCKFAITFFAPEARQTSNALVARGKLRGGEDFYYRLLAFAQTEPRVAGSAKGFKVDDEPRPLAIRDGALAPLLDASVAIDAGEAPLNPVFIPEAVLEETRELTLQAEAREVGGIFLGRLQRDTTLPDIGLVVTAQIPARQALGEADKLTFTAEAWAAVEAAIALRRSDEIICGWWHSHPAKYWCAEKECAEAARRNCSLQHGYFSAHDVLLHGSVFPKAFNIALVVTHADDGCRHALFGWNQGAVRHRGYRLLPTCRGSSPLHSTIVAAKTELRFEPGGSSASSRQRVWPDQTGCPSEEQP
jgi:hypothetical protein